MAQTTYRKATKSPLRIGFSSPYQHPSGKGGRDGFGGAAGDHQLCHNQTQKRGGEHLKSF